MTGAESFPTVIPTFMTKVEWDKDEHYFAQLGEIEVLVVALVQKVRDTRAAVGAEATGRRASFMSP
jgi:hypothetical protein